jgi:uncharacterized protein YjbI with pentapeptide repeats
MSIVVYYKGLTCECDLSLSTLKIDGRPVSVDIANGEFASPELPGEKTSTLRQLAEKIIDGSPELLCREAARQAHLTILKKGGIDQWNSWRRNHPDIRPLLYDSDLSKDGFGEDLSNGNFANAVLINANLTKTVLNRANFHEANLGGANLSSAELRAANFCRTDLYGTNLCHADLTDANLQGTQLAGTNFDHAKLINCTIYGLSAWDLKLHDAVQKDLAVLYKQDCGTQDDGLLVESRILVDDLRSAQFVYLLLNNWNIREAIDELTSKVVLILGRFGGGGLENLRTLGECLRETGYVPIIFEFTRPRDRTYTETVRILAGLAQFVVADLSGPAVPHELSAIVPDLKIPFVPVLERGAQPYSLFRDLLENDSVLRPVVEFDSAVDLCEKFKSEIRTAVQARVEERRAKLKDIYVAKAP